MAWYRAGGGGIPSAIKTDMNAVLNKKFGTSQDYPPTDWAPTVNLLGPLPEKAASGSVANITDGADRVPVKNWGVTVDATLSGVSSVVCRQTGANLWNESWETGAISETTGANTVNNNKIRPTGLIAVKPSTSFYIVCPQLIQILFYRKDETYIGIGSGYGSSRVFTTDAETYFIRFNVANAYGNTYNNDISVNYPSTDTSYHAHTTQTVNTVSLGRTIYGGSVDVVAGTGTDENGNDFTFTPITPTPETALGVNNFWADEGDSDVTYRADIDLLLGGN